MGHGIHTIILGLLCISLLNPSYQANAEVLTRFYPVHVSDLTSDFIYTPPKTGEHMNLSITVDSEEPNGISFNAFFGSSEVVSTSKALDYNGIPGNPALSGEILPGEGIWIYLEGKSCFQGDVIFVETIEFDRIGSENVEANVTITEFRPEESICSTENPYGGNDLENWSQNDTILAAIGLFSIFVVIMVLVTRKRADLMKAKEKYENEKR